MSDFFKNFPTIDYNITSNNYESKNVTNILTSFYVNKFNYEKSLFFQKFFLKDQDIPESLSYEIYKDTLFYWIILFINDIIGPYSEWVMEYDVLLEFVRKKYQNGKQIKKKDGTIHTIPLSEGIYGIHHFYNVVTEKIIDDYNDTILRKKYAINPNYIGEHIVPVTNFQYESEINFQRRIVSIVSPTRIYEFENDYFSMLSSKKGD